MIGRVVMILLAGIAGLILVAIIFGAARVQQFEDNAPAIGEFVEVLGVKLHVVDIGPKESDLAPVVLIHGASSNLRDMLISLGESLSQERRVLIFDRPGHGYSARPDDGWKLDRQADLIYRAALARGAERPIIVGQSFGGAVALALGLQHQAELAGLVLLAPVSHEWPGGVAWYNRAAGIPVIGGLLVRSVLPFYGPATIDGSIKAAFAPLDPPENYILRSGVELLFRPRNFASNAEDLRFLKRQVIQQQHRYTELALPVMIVASEDDSTVSTRLHAEALAREVQRADFVRLKTGGHPLQHTKTDIAVDMIKRLDGIER